MTSTIRLPWTSASFSYRVIAWIRSILSFNRATASFTCEALLWKRKIGRDEFIPPVLVQIGHNRRGVPAGLPLEVHEKLRPGDFPCTRACKADRVGRRLIWSGPPSAPIEHFKFSGAGQTPIDRRSPVVLPVRRPLSDGHNCGLI